MQMRIVDVRPVRCQNEMRVQVTAEKVVGGEVERISVWTESVDDAFRISEKFMAAVIAAQGGQMTFHEVEVDQ